MRSLFAVLILFSIQTFAIPKIFFAYGYYYDRLCSRRFEYKDIDLKSKTDLLHDEWVSEAKTRKNEFEKIWETDGNQLLGVLVSDFKKDFSRKEYSAILSTCDLGSNMSDPFVLNIKNFLMAYSKDRRKPLSQFVDFPFHELLHVWLFENFKPDNSAVLKKYKNLEDRVTMHIHLYALQSYIYEKTDKTEIWKAIKDRFFKENSVNKKAIEIMEKEGRDRLISEIKSNL